MHERIGMAARESARLRVAARLKTARADRRGLKIDEAVELLSAAGICNSRSTLLAWESGRRQPSADDLAALAEFYGVTVGWLFAPEG